MEITESGLNYAYSMQNQPEKDIKYTYWKAETCNHRWCGNVGTVSATYELPQVGLLSLRSRHEWVDGWKLAEPHFSEGLLADCESYINFDSVCMS